MPVTDRVKPIKGKSSVLPDLDVRTAARRVALAALEPGGEELWGALFAVVGDLSMVAPFDWPKWQEPWPETAEAVAQMDKETVGKHMTRIMRSNRFIEGNFEAAAKSGLVSHLVLRWLDLTEPTLSDLTETAVPEQET